MMMDFASSHEFDPTLPERFSGAPFFLGTPFSDEDRAIMNSIAALVPTLSTLLGKHCEIVVHSLEDPAHAVIASANARLSHRELGNPIQQEGMETLLEKMERKEAYFCRGRAGQRLKVDISPVMNAHGRCLGSLSIALNLEAPFIDIVSQLSPEEVHNREEMRIWGTGPVKLEDMIAKTCAEVDARHGISGRNRAKRIIAELYGKGVFNHRNAVPLVSEYTGISTVTVYWHLRELKKEGERQQS